MNYLEVLKSGDYNFIIGLGVIVVIVLFVLAFKLFIKKFGDDDFNDLNEASDDEGDDYDDEGDDEPERFVTLDDTDLPYDWGDTFGVIVDRKTRVQYLSFGDYGLTPYIDAEGKPILYEGKIPEE